MDPVRLTRAAGMVLSLLLLALATIPKVAWPDEPMLAIRLAGGENVLYPVGEIERIGFGGGGMLVVVTAGGPDSYPLTSIDRVDFLSETAAVEDPEGPAALVKAVHLFQNLPNPLSAETRIGFELPLAGQVELGIFSPQGRLVRRLVNGTRAAGRHEVHWDGLNDSGRKASSGVYFYSLKAPGIVESRRMIVLP